MKSDFNTNVDSKMQDLYTKLKSRKTYFENTKGQFVESNKFIVDSGKTLTDLSSCKIMRREAVNMIGNGCYRFGKHFSIQSIILLIIGPLMILLSFYVCCAVIKSTPASSHQPQNYTPAQAQAQDQSYPNPPNPVSYNQMQYANVGPNNQGYR